MWIKTTDCEPLNDGCYMIQNKWGGVSSMWYTLDGGWNTWKDYEGVLHDDSKIESDYIIRWFDLPKPPELKGGE